MRAFSTRSLLRTCAHAAVAGAFAVVLVAGSGSGVRAEDEDDMLDVKVLRHIMEGIGLKRPGSEANIEYRERSPLVVPPTSDLPPPEAAAMVEKNPAWPDDPDVKARREAKKQVRRSTDWDEEARALTPRELDKKGARTASAGPASSKPTEEAINPVKPSELGYGGGLFSWRSLVGAEPKEEFGTFEKEPARTDLTQPPPGYLTPSPSQPYGVSKTVERATKPKSVDQAVGNGETR